MAPASLLRSLAAGTAAALLSLSAASAAPAGPPAAPRAEERSSFIVTLHPGVDSAATAADWRDRGAEIGHVYRHALAGFSGRMGAELARQVGGDSRVASVEKDGAVHVTGVQSSPPWGLDRVDQRTRPLDASYAYDSEASGVTAYVLDTGVRATHVDFGGRAVAGYTAIADGLGTDDCHGHGSHVAGTLAGATYGVAKAVTVVPVRVLGCDGSGSWSGVIAGIDWVTGHHQAGQPAVANMSLGGGVSSSVDTAVRNSIADGVTYVVAAGNTNVDACTASPARVAEALTVAATGSTDARASFSNWGSCVDLFAPGVSITSAHHGSDTAKATMSGTSMASPHVAGVAALYLAGAPSAAPSSVAEAVARGATADVVSDTAGAPNRLAYSRLAADGSPVASAPATPAAPKAAAGKRAVSVSWTAPSDGGSPITGYTIRVHTASNGSVAKSVTVAGSATRVTVSGLTAGTAYYATVAATNAVGSSGWSSPSNTVTATK